MTKQLRPPTPRSVGTVLRNAGFERSVRRPSRIRGFAEYSEGYKLGVSAEGVVEVEWRPSSFWARSVTEEEVKAKLGLYRAALADAGYAVTDGTSIIRYTLHVSLPDRKA